MNKIATLYIKAGSDSGPGEALVTLFLPLLWSQVPPNPQNQNLDSNKPHQGVLYYSPKKVTAVSCMWVLLKFAHWLLISAVVGLGMRLGELISCESRAQSAGAQGRSFAPLSPSHSVRPSRRCHTGAADSPDIGFTGTLIQYVQGNLRGTVLPCHSSKCWNPNSSKMESPRSTQMEPACWPFAWVCSGLS